MGKKSAGERVRALWWERGALRAIDQRRLPRELKVLRLTKVGEVADAIRTLAVRGAPTIGVAAAYGMVLASHDPRWSATTAARLLGSTRPTAHDLFVGIGVVRRAWDEGEDLLGAAEGYRDAVVEECRAIGSAGAPLVAPHARVLTHCNAGALATVEWGTALAPVRLAYREGRDPFVWVDETRPLLQGARLTAWELEQEGIRHAVIADNAAGHFLHRREVDLVIVGADRITRSGDFANKVGTYEKAVLAHENGVPFYVAAPWSTFDPRLEKGEDIPVEERAREEVTTWGQVVTAPEGSPARNPAFDVTPSRYVTAFVTPAGLVSPGRISSLLRAHRPERPVHEHGTHLDSVRLDPKGAVRPRRARLRS
ncbi:MAG: S-methyl-5-thioribose-1-phosphate isomerase [Euryarchaeota archaeon]|nr:S-methyl-5-thioribose-1-phosphate isomerase [Euryarchaeota archaeon]MDE1836325.1 S-methyl-5-thioribose-1-phosphate isomerase [Euryarchaeota archaeon]MDE1879123.1 S-methyl-5-thioribose-1-phosphate isomerase [Euryarchaeota archaeon]MDE2044279.1 S-methyl-5-thioribose-1-phosphate isomerase [Thermoplasmata archaeon]